MRSFLDPRSFRSWYMNFKGTDESGIRGNLSGSFDVLWSEWSLIADLDSDHPKEIETKKLGTAFLITCTVPLLCYLHEAGMFADTQHLLLILFSVHPRRGEDFSVGLNVCLSFYKKVKIKSCLHQAKGPRATELNVVSPPLLPPPPSSPQTPWAGCGVQDYRRD